jgi:hypothetical protein
MPTIWSRVIGAPAGAVNDIAPRFDKPLFCGTDADYLGSNCGYVIAAGMGPAQRVIVDSAVCSACGAKDKFPPHPRAWLRPRCMKMPIKHPHAEARYRVIAFDNGSFGVEVSIPDSHPTTVSTFKTAADAEAWIIEHRRRVQSQTPSGRQFRGLRSRRGI